jgi:crotonobetainyl-CoA:carnitine CoA-transferase CaiB-like acyl-CoA transferase
MVIVSSQCSGSSAVLRGLRVLDRSDTVSGQFASRLLADHGADVVLVEPACGTATRRLGPMDVGDESYLFSHLNAGKRSMLTDRVGDLVVDADVVVVDDQIDTGPLQERQILCSITGFGRAGPYAQWTCSELEYQALSGLAFSTGREDDYPLYGFGHRAEYSAGVAGYVGIVAALLDRERCGRGQSVDVSIFEIAVAMSQNLPTQYSYNGTVPGRGQYHGPLGRFRCADGWIFVFVLPGRWPALCALLDLREYIDDPRFADNKSLTQNWRQAEKLLAPAVAQRKVGELVEEGQRARIAISPAMTPREVWRCEALRASAFWRDMPSVGGPSAVRLGPLCEELADSEVMARAAPAIGAHTSEIWRDWRSSRKPLARGMRTGMSRKMPLEGTRVIELTTSWAGPMCGRVLSHLGADVIKVESIHSLDAWRGPVVDGDPRRYPLLEPGLRPYNRSSWFNVQNQGKRSVEVDLKTPAGHEVIRDLLRTADAFICNLGPGSLGRLGLTYERVTQLSPNIVLIEISAFGVNGWMADHVGVGPTVEATTGSTYLMSYADGQPQGSGHAYLDPIAGWGAAAVALTGLLRERRVGLGVHARVSLRELSLQWLGEYLLAAASGDELVAAAENRSIDAAPHVLVRALGENEYLAVSASSTTQWHALCGAIGRVDLASDLDLGSLSTRAAREPMLRSAIEAWSSTLDKHEAAKRLQSVGVPAAPVMNAANLHDDIQLVSRGFYREVSHSEAGTHRYPIVPIRLSALATGQSTPAPCLGEHTSDVLIRSLGYSSAKVSALRRQQVIDASRGNAEA